MRLITNLIRTRNVTEVDWDKWLYQVKTGELETNWIKWLKLRGQLAHPLELSVG